MNTTIFIYCGVCWLICMIWFNYSVIKDRRRDADWSMLVLLSPIISGFAWIVPLFFIIIFISLGLCKAIETIFNK